MNFEVHTYCEGALAEVREYDSMAAAAAFAIGVMRGASLYGAGSCVAFVLPDEAEELRDWLESRR